MKTTGIYIIENIISSFKYIGLSLNIEKRFTYHKRRLEYNKHSNEHLQYSYNKNGVSSFTYSILEECTEELICEREKYWILYYSSFDRKFGYNKTYGGEFGRVSEEINKRRTEKLKKQIIPQDQRDRISKSLMGRVQNIDLVNKRAKSNRKCSDTLEGEICSMYLTHTVPEVMAHFNLKHSLITSVVRRHGMVKRIRTKK